MDKLKAWKAANGNGTILYSSLIEMESILKSIDAINPKRDKGIIFIVNNDIVRNALTTFKNINIHTPFTMGFDVNRYIVVVINPNSFSDFELDIVATSKSRYTLLLDNKPVEHELLNKLFPLIKVTITAATVNNFKHMVVSFDGDELTDYEKLESIMTEIMDTFDNFDDISACLRGDGTLNPRDYRLEYAKRKGWSVDMSTSNRLTSDIAKLYNPDAIFERAETYTKLLHKRIDLLSNNDAIVKCVHDIHKANPAKGIVVLSKNGKVNDKLETAIGDEAISIHKDMVKQPLMDPNTNDYIRYKSGEHKGKVKLHGSIVLTNHYVQRFNMNGSITLLAITGSIERDISIKNVDLLIITSLKTLSYIELRNRLKGFNADIVLNIVMNSNRVLKEFNFINNKNVHKSINITSIDKVFV